MYGEAEYECFSCVDDQNHFTHDNVRCILKQKKAVKWFTHLVFYVIYFTEELMNEKSVEKNL